MSGSTIKLIAILLMTIDHVAAYLMCDTPSCNQVLCSFMGWDITVVTLMRGVGRMAFPLFGWLLVEGYIHTRNRFKYGRNLFLFALLSEIPFDLAAYGGWHLAHQNVFFTLWFAYYGLNLFEGFKNDLYNRTVAALVLFVTILLFRSDYCFAGFFYVMVLYYMRQYMVMKMLVGCYILPDTLFTLPATVPVMLYNGKRGFIKGTFFKYCFYIYYPLHLLVIWLLK